MEPETILCLHCMTQVPIDTTVAVGTHIRTKREYRVCVVCLVTCEDGNDTRKAIKASNGRVVEAVVA